METNESVAIKKVLQDKRFKVRAGTRNGVKECDHMYMYCLGSLVGKSISWKADGRVFESHL